MSNQTIKTILQNEMLSKLMESNNVKDSDKIINSILENQILSKFIEKDNIKKTHNGIFINFKINEQYYKFDVPFHLEYIRLLGDMNDVNNLATANELLVIVVDIVKEYKGEWNENTKIYNDIINGNKFIYFL